MNQPQNFSSRHWPAGLLAIILLALAFAARPAAAAIALARFEAFPGDGSIQVEWETSAETDLAGFYLTRSNQSGGAYDPVSTLIAPQGVEGLGAQYSYLDEDVINGNTYYYILEEVESDQSITQHGPISAVAGETTATPTATASASPTATPSPSTTADTETPTATVTGSQQATETRTPTPTKTTTLRPTLTLFPTVTNTRTPTPTPVPPTDTITPTPTASRTPRPTLIAPPNIIIVNRATPAGSPSPTSTATIEATRQATAGLLPGLIASGNFPRLALAAAVILIWSGLAVALFWYLRQRRT